MKMLAKRKGNGFPPFFDELWGDFMMESPTWPMKRSVAQVVPAVNVIEKDDLFMIEVAVPGMDKKDFELNLDNRLLTISCHKEEEEEQSEGDYTRKEFSYSAFERSFTLPDMIDMEHIDASYADGILKIKLPKSVEAKQKQPKVIDVG